MTPDFDFKLDGLPPLHKLGITTVNPDTDGVWRVRVDTDIGCQTFVWATVFESHDEKTARDALRAFTLLRDAARLMVQP